MFMDRVIQYSSSNRCEFRYDDSFLLLHSMNNTTFTLKLVFDVGFANADWPVFGHFHTASSRGSDLLLWGGARLFPRPPPFSHTLSFHAYVCWNTARWVSVVVWIMHFFPFAKFTKCRMDNVLANMPPTRLFSVDAEQLADLVILPVYCQDC